MNEEERQEEREEREEKNQSPSFNVSDRRHWALRETEEGEAPPEKRRLPTYLQQLQEQLETKDRKLSEFMEKVEQENAQFRERQNRELDRRMEQARTDLLLQFLPMLDNLERAIASAEEHGASDNLLEGIKMVCGQFLGQLKKEGVEPIEVVGKPFDPSVSEALGMAPTKNPEEDNNVSEEMEKGYTINGKLLRPAKVRILRHTAERGE